jgi:hypothetical protein
MPTAAKRPVQPAPDVAPAPEREPTSELADVPSSPAADSFRKPEQPATSARTAKPAPGQLRPPAAGERASGRKERPELSKTAELENQRKRIEAEVQAALQNRAITGVVVSVVDGTAYLDGRVASVRQKAMAERAARSVAEVKRVRNRLDVSAS